MIIGRSITTQIAAHAVLKTGIHGVGAKYLAISSGSDQLITNADVAAAAGIPLTKLESAVCSETEAEAMATFENLDTKSDVGVGAAQLAAGDHTHTLVAEAQSATKTTVAPGTYGAEGYKTSLSMPGDSEIDPFITKTDTFSALSMAVAGFAGILQAGNANYLKLRLYMDGELVNESDFISTDFALHTLFGSKALSGSKIVKVTVKNHHATNTTIFRWFAQDETTDLMHPVLIIGSVKV